MRAHLRALAGTFTGTFGFQACVLARNVPANWLNAMSMVKCAGIFFYGHIRPRTQHRGKTPFSLNEPVQGFGQCKRGARSGKKKGKKGEKEKKGRKKRFNIDTTFT